MFRVLLGLFAILAAEDVCEREPIQIVFLSGSEAKAVGDELQAALEEPFLKTRALGVAGMFPAGKGSERLEMLYGQIVLLLAEHGEYLIIDGGREQLREWKELLKDYPVLYVNLSEKEEAGFDLRVVPGKEGIAKIKKIVEASECFPQKE